MAFAIRSPGVSALPPPAGERGARADLVDVSPDRIQDAETATDVGGDGGDKRIEQLRPVGSTSEP